MCGLFSIKVYEYSAINAVSEKQRRRKVYILVTFSESFPTTYNIPTCDEPMGLRWYSTVIPTYISVSFFCRFCFKNFVPVTVKNRVRVISRG